MSNKTLKVTWIKSIIGHQERHRRTIKALGFKRLNQTLVKADSPQIRGMLHSVDFLLRVEEESK